MVDASTVGPASATAGLVSKLAFLDPPYNVTCPPAEEPLTLRVRRYEIGLVEREVPDPPGLVIRAGIRFHLAAAENPLLGEYLDFTNLGLIIQVVDLVLGLIGRVREAGLALDAALVLALVPEGLGTLTLRLTRHGERLDSRYSLELVEGG